MESVHATSVAWDGQAVLLFGPPGSGKSDLALRLIDQGWALVSDDYTELDVDGDRLIARAPGTIKNLLEVRGIGIVRVPSQDQAPVACAFELQPLSAIERLPEPATKALLGKAVPLYALHGTDASAPAKVRLTLKALRDNLFHQA